MKISTIVRVSAVAMGAALVSPLVAVLPAGAAMPDVQNAHDVLRATAPFVLSGDDADTTVDVIARATSRVRSTSAAAPQVKVTAAPEGSEAQTVSMSLDGALTAGDSVQGVTTFSTGSPDVARYVTEDGLGARVLTAYAKAQSSYESRTTFNLPADVQPVERPNGTWLLRSASGVQGVIAAPWARDAAGTSLETSYRWEGSTLVQSVDVPSTATFPVVADPAWSYTWTASVTVGSPTDIHKKMHDCFNCIFPVEGAPKAFPKPGQKLPLVVRAFPGAPLPVSFACVFQQELYVPSGNPLYPTGDFAFAFNADKGHVDGEGSLISFDWYGTATDPHRPIASEKMELIVYGNILNSNPAGLPQGVYRTGAKVTWGKFLDAYTGTLGGYPGNPKWGWLN